MSKFPRNPLEQSKCEYCGEKVTSLSYFNHKSLYCKKYSYSLHNVLVPTATQSQFNIKPIISIASTSDFSKSSFSNARKLTKEEQKELDDLGKEIDKLSREIKSGPTVDEMRKMIKEAEVLSRELQIGEKKIEKAKLSAFSLPPYEPRRPATWERIEIEHGTPLGRYLKYRYGIL